MKKRLKIILGTVLLLSVMLMAAGCSLVPTVASVNGEDISSRDYVDYLNKVIANFEQQQPGVLSGEGAENGELMSLLKTEVINYMVDEVLVTQEAKKLGLYPNNDEIEAEVDAVAAGYSSDKEFKDALRSNGLNMKTLREYLARVLASDKLIEKIAGNVEVTNEELKQFYEENKEYLTDENGKVQTLESVRDLLKNELLQNKKTEKYSQYMNEVREKSVIRYNPSYDL